MKFNKIISISAVSALLAVTASGCGDSAMGNQVEVFELEKQVISDSVNTSGTVEGASTRISNNQNTKAVKVNVKDGDLVEKGDVLFEFDATELQDQLEELTSQHEIEDDKIKHEQTVNNETLTSVRNEKSAMLEQAKRKIDEAKSARDKVYSNFDDMNKQCENLINEINNLTTKINGATSDEEYAQLDEALITANENLNALEAELNALNSELPSYDNLVRDAEDAYSNTERSYNDKINDVKNNIETDKFNTNSVEQKEIDRLKKQIERCVVTAPVSGVVVNLQVTEGAIPMVETLVSIVDTSDLFVTASISEAEVFKLKPGMEAEIQTVATEDSIIKGKLKRISNLPQISADGSGSGYAVEIDIDERTAGDNLFLGMAARTDIILSKTGEVLAFPYDSIMSEGEDEENSKKYVLAAVPDGKNYLIQKIYVETGYESSYYIEASAEELKEGMFIICYPEFYVEGEHIDVKVQ